MKKLMTTCLLAGVLLTAGCYKTHIVNGSAAPASYPAPGYDDRLNHNVIAGLVNLSGPVRLKEVCPTGWARVDVQKGPISILIGMVLSSFGVSALYEPQNISVWCADGKGAHIWLDKRGHVINAIPVSQK